MRRCSYLVFLGALLFLVTSVWPAHAKDDPEAAKSMVEKAIAYYKAEGKEKAFSEINNPDGRFMKGDLYVFVYDLNGVAIARPVQKGLIGNNIIDAKDGAGKPYVKERLELVKAKGKGWQDYKYFNPTTKKMEDKKAWIETWDGYVFGCGAYKGQ
jgi:signal transduction histidine kinase